MAKDNPLVPSARFGYEEAVAACLNWGANCGPAALAAMTGKSLEEVRPYLGEFEGKGYMNPTLMFESLRRLKVGWTVGKNPKTWPAFGLARIQWEGPWMAPGVPIAARYRYTHWVGCVRDKGAWIFDVNYLSEGGWMSAVEWGGSLVPWLLQQTQPRANGRWHIATAIEIEPKTVLQ